MKRTANRMVLAAVAMLATAAIGSAQSMKAEIPFAFYTGSARLQPGTYSVEVSRSMGGPAIVHLYSRENRQSVVRVPMTNYEERSGSAGPVLRFACTEGSCELAALRDGNSNFYEFHTGKKGPATRIASVALRQGGTE